MNLRTILLAEDNQNDVDLTILALSEFNLANNIQVVCDGVEVLEYLRSQGKFKNRKEGYPAVILLDLKMPRMDGIEVLKEIKKDPVLKYIPVVMVTSSREENDLIQSYKLGVNAYVVKPVDFNQFISAIKQLGAFWAVLNEIPALYNKKA
jgi:CheY-like chemotaxis protein